MGFGSEVEAVRQAESFSDAFKAFSQSIQRLGYDCANYVLVTDHPSISLPTQFGFATDYPAEWIDYYMEQNYQDFDPVWRRIRQRSGIFSWDDAELEFLRSVSTTDEAKGYCRKVMREANEAGLMDGIAMSFFNRFGEIAGIGIARENIHSSPSDEDIAQIYFISNILHDKIQGMHAKATEIVLTRRERDVLSWVAEAKTDDEIATILSVSTSTVRFHLRNIYKKLDVNSRVSATSAALNRRLIDPTIVRSSK